VLSYVGVNQQYPPGRDDEFTTALTRLVSPIVHEMVRRMEPISPVYSSRATGNRWRQLQTLRGDTETLPHPVRSLQSASARTILVGQGSISGDALAFCSRR
jgi:hypothetical protein